MTRDQLSGVTFKPLIGLTPVRNTRVEHPQRLILLGGMHVGFVWPGKGGRLAITEPNLLQSEIDEVVEAVRQEYPQAGKPIFPPNLQQTQTQRAPVDDFDT